MDNQYLKRLQSFTLTDLPDLDEVVLATLAFLENQALPQIDVHEYKRPLVIGSVNALRTGQIMFWGTDAVFAEEIEWEAKLTAVPAIDAIYIISASGGKHAIAIAETAGKRALPVTLITSNVAAPARSYLPPEQTVVFPHLREPYTYNTSTYLTMIQSVTAEPLAELQTFIETVLAPVLSGANLAQYRSFILVVPNAFSLHRGMLETKFDELFGSERPGRVFTTEEMKHAKTVIPSQHEAIITFGPAVTFYGSPEARITIPLPTHTGPAAFLALGYFVIGHLQKAQPPFFKQNIERYCREASLLFGQSIKPIVE